MNLGNLVKWSVILFALAVIIYLAVWVRSSTISSPTVLDYDPWWYYRYAQMILNNNFQVPKWDIQSYFPGRPTSTFQGWPYTMIFFYEILKNFSVSFMQSAILAPLIMVALLTIPAFLLGRMLTNSLGGLVTALFIVLTPAFIGVTMAGYSDSDAIVAFYSFLSVFATLLVIKTKNIKAKYYLIPLAVLANLLFIWNWGGGWITLILFAVFTFFLPFFRVIENLIHTYSLKIDFSSLFKEWFEIGQPIFIVIVLTNIFSTVLLNSDIFDSLFGGIAFAGLGLVIRSVILVVMLAWTGMFAYGFLQNFRKSPLIKNRAYYASGIAASAFVLYILISGFLSASVAPLLVNISVAELQPIDLTYAGFLAIAGRSGMLPTMLAFGVFALAIYKVWKKEKISPEEVFFYIWILIMFILISRGIRFSLQFSVAASVAAGFMIGSYKKYPMVLLLILTVTLLIFWQTQGLFSVVNAQTAAFAFVFALPFLAIYKKNEKIITTLILGLFVFQTLFFVSYAIQIGQASGMDISSNWYNALNWLTGDGYSSKTIVVTWWDPGHIIAGYSYYKNKPLYVMADGSHCPPGECIPYNHNTRIQDMGFVFTTDNETEAISVLEKYRNTDPNECTQIKDVYDDIVPSDACKPASNMYVIASSDLIGKYVWMNYFGDNFKGAQSNIPGSCYPGTADAYVWCFWQLTNPQFDSSGNLVYPDSSGSPVITLQPPTGKTFMQCIQEDNCTLYPILGSKFVVKEIVYFDYNGRQRYANYANQTNIDNKYDGMVWVEPGFGVAIYMPLSVRNSIFTRMFFFNGAGLNNFTLVYPNSETAPNPEVKIFKVTFPD